MTKYTFVLTDINLDLINTKYFSDYKVDYKDEKKEEKEKEEKKVEKKTKISDILNKEKFKEYYPFLDETKIVKTCKLSVPSSKGGICFWDRNPIPGEIYPIGCPTRYVSNKITKTYTSEISQETYNITENITEERLKDVQMNNKFSKPKFKTEENNFYETDGIFCSFNCCLAFINDNNKNILYDNSKNLLFKMYFDYFDSKDEIIPAPHWRLLKEYGGVLSIEKFRENFNKVSYTEKGLFSFVPLGILYQESFRL
jgi:hypothetical protein